MNSNLDRVKPWYIVEIKYKTKYKRYLANSFDGAASFVHFKCVEISDDLVIDSLEMALKLFVDNQQLEKFYPWSSIVDVDLKRFLKNQL